MGKLRKLYSGGGDLPPEWETMKMRAILNGGKWHNPAPKKYKPATSIKRTKAALGSASYLPGPVGLGARAASITGDLYTAGRYAADGQWTNAGKDAMQAAVSLLPFLRLPGFRTTTGYQNPKDFDFANKLVRTSEDARELMGMEEDAEEGDKKIPIFSKKPSTKANGGRLKKYATGGPYTQNAAQFGGLYGQMAADSQKLTYGVNWQQHAGAAKTATTAKPGTASGIGAIAGLVGAGADAIDPGNQYGRQAVGTTVLKGMATGASTGAIAGSVIPGVGNAVGAAAGAVIGGAVGYISGSSKKKREKAKILQDQWTKTYREQQAGNMAMASDPSLVGGYADAGYYAQGGRLSRAVYNKNGIPSTGGSLEKLSSDTVQVDGRTHEEGGVRLPGNNEVEDKETIQGDYVFSERLGFASKHARLAKAIGKIEKKPVTPERLNSLMRLRRQEDNLKQAQEYLRNSLNLQ